MKAIYKYPLEVTDTQRIELPEGARFLSLQVQNQKPCIWAEVDPDPDLGKVTVAIEMFGTGHEFDYCPGTFIGTIQLMGGTLIFHVYMRDEL